jgi:hypothetical protein
MNISIHRDGQQYGPYTLEQVQQHVADGTLLPATDLAWCEGMTEWEPLQSVVARLVPAPPPVPQSLVPPPLESSPPTSPHVEAIPNKETSDPKTFWIAFTLCLFFGVFGAHRFYFGKKSAWLMLVTFGFCGIWWLIDLILLLANQFKDRKGIKVINPKPAVTWPVAAAWLLICFTTGDNKPSKQPSKETTQSSAGPQSEQNSSDQDNASAPTQLKPFIENIYEGTTDTYTMVDKQGQPLAFNGTPIDPIPKVNVGLGFVHGKLFLNQIEYPQSWSSRDAYVYTSSPTVLEDTSDYVKVEAHFEGVSQNATYTHPEYIITFQKDGKSAILHSDKTGEPDTKLNNLFAAENAPDSSATPVSNEPNQQNTTQNIIGTWSASEDYPRALSGSITVTITLNEDGTYSRDTDGLSDHIIHDEGQWKLNGDSLALTTLEGPAAVPVGPPDECYPTKDGLIIHFDGGQITLKKQ